MLVVDGRAGSKDLLKPLIEMGLPAEEGTLDFGDVAFVGRGEKGVPLFIGLEHKKLSDLVQSLEGRLPGHQLPGMLQMYDRCFLIVEGDWSADTTGRVTMFRGKRTKARVKGAPPAVELEKRLLTLEIRGGLHVRCCPTRKDSLRYIYAQYRWWTDASLDSHKSHMAVFNPDLDKGLMVPMSDFRHILASIPGVGFRTSGAVEQHLLTTKRTLGSLTVDEWAEITTTDDNGKQRRLGATRAAQIKRTVEQLQ